MSENEVVAKTVRIRGELITLGELIKFVGLADTGGRVKDMLATGAFIVNGEYDKRRGRKLYNDDVVVAPDGRSFRIQAEIVAS